MTCTFFGHRDAPERIRGRLHDVLTDLIENRGADTFCVGSQGRFDEMVLYELKKLSESYPHIRYSVVLAYMPGKSDKSGIIDHSETVYPDGLENVPRRFAIDKRNRLMIEWSDTVITYVCSPGGAAKYKEIAERKGKRIIELFY